LGRLFGTDGARGVANTELTCELSMEIGRAAAMVLTKQTNKKPKVLIGMDTRASSLIGEESVTIEDVYEPYLMQLGFLTRTPRGRKVTPLGYKHLGFNVPLEDGEQNTFKNY